MTTHDGPLSGPLFPIPGGAGRFADGRWLRFIAGDQIVCPGQKPSRAWRDSDRRADLRLEPCPHRWGRVPTGSVTLVRWRLLNQSLAPGPSVILDCPACHRNIELYTSAAEAA